MATIDELAESKTKVIGYTRGHITMEHYYIRALPEYNLKQDIYYCGLVILYPNTKVSFQIVKAKDGKYFAYNVEVVPT